jgi:pilus assembly protein CpaF
MSDEVVEAVHAALVREAGAAATLDAGWVRARILEHLPLASTPQLDSLVDAVLARARGFGQLDALLADEAITDVMVNGDGSVWIERGGRLARTSQQLAPAETMRLIERVVGPLGLRVDRATPTVDARLPDGARVHAVVPPLAVDGPCLTIRRFGARTLPLEAFASAEVAHLLTWAVHARANLLVSGGTGAGKTSLLNSLASRIERVERIVTVEDAAELRLPLPHVVRLEARLASTEGLGAITIRDLVRTALRMRPDRLLVGEVRGGEALDLLQAMNTGHDGSLSTCHANSAPDALRRLETMVLLSDVALPLAAVREQIAAAVDLLVHVARGNDGQRRVVEVRELEPGRAMRTRLLADASGVLAAPGRGARAPDVEPFQVADGTPSNRAGVSC